MKKFICIAKCPELDCNKLSHCISTEEGLERKNENGRDYCPCGNQEIWEEVIEESEEK